MKLRLLVDSTFSWMTCQQLEIGIACTIKAWKKCVAGELVDTEVVMRKEQQAVNIILYVRTFCYLPGPSTSKSFVDYRASKTFRECQVLVQVM